MKHFIIAVLSVCISSAAFAAGLVDTAKVIQVRVDSDGKGMVIFDRPIAGTPPSCVISAYTNALAFSNTPAGKSVMTLALTAKITGNPISAFGLGTCATYGGFVEDWNYGVAQ
jgi:hypothetical protein